MKSITTIEAFTLFLLPIFAAFWGLVAEVIIAKIQILM